MSGKLRALLHYLQKTVRGNTVHQSTQGNGVIGSIPDNAYQFGPGHLSSSSEPLDVVVGVDFGTSSTKVVIHAPYHTGNPAFAIPFGDLAHESLKYLLPTRLFASKDGRCSLTVVSEASLLTDIKLGLMKNPLCSIESASGPSCDAPASTVAVAYLALVLRYARCWFIANKRDVFGEFPLKWSFNLGLPAAIDDDSALREAFLTSGKAAWLVSIRPGPITISAAQDAVSDVKGARYDIDCYFDVVPEVIAEVKGYAESRFRSPGLHLLVDIGASTLDVCSFNLREIEDSAPLPIFTADVDLLGAKRLHRARIDGANEAMIAHATSIVDESDPVSRIPDNIEAYVPPGQEKDQAIHKKITTAETDFAKDCAKFLRKTIIHLRTKRDQNSPRWCEELPVFVCGGAKDMRLYREVMSCVHSWLPTYIRSSHGIRRIDLPKPESLEAEVNNDSYHRLAVAWGLSHLRFNIATYRRPSEIKDMSPKKKRNISERVFVNAELPTICHADRPF